MKKALKFLIAYCSFTYCLLPNANSQMPPAYWQQQVNFKIDVTLNDIDHTLDGFIKMDYYNNSPDTLHFIWMHLWPNAYKNDRTAFNDQELENGKTAFYFSNNDQRGYINRLDFKVNGIPAKTEDHPQHQDIIKLILPNPVAPNSSAKIETPFHIKLPFVFSRGGHIGQSFQVTQWYPKPAVYDRKGWHPIPYLDQGEFYSEFGNYNVQITLPKNYVVAATGTLQNEEELKWIAERTYKKWGKEFVNLHSGNKKMLIGIPARDSIDHYNPPSSPSTKTLQFRQDYVHDFAWFADKRFVVEMDTIQLASGRIIHSYACYLPFNNKEWNNSSLFIKNAILSKSKQVGEYPYNTVTVVDDAAIIGGGMEYPTITVLSSGGTERSLNLVTCHEIGHNWFYGTLASNERAHPWMDEGMNTYYDKRYAKEQYGSAGHLFVKNKRGLLNNKIPDNIELNLLHTLTKIKKDQPIETSSENFSAFNYGIIAYIKTAEWMSLLEEKLGKELMDSCMREYYRRWHNKHPYPEDFKNVLEEVSSKNLDAEFLLLNRKGELQNKPVKKDFRLSAFFNFKETDKHNYIFVSPAIGYNFYDKQMFGGVLHNYTLPPSPFQFIVAPMYATNSKKLNGIGRFSYTIFPGERGQKATLSLSGETFTADTYTDSAKHTHFQRFSKIVPSLKFVFASKDPRSTLSKWIQWKTFIITEQGLLFSRDTVRQTDIVTFPVRSRYINQLQFTVENYRALYPYKGVLQLEQGEGFIKTGFTGNYYFNYTKGGGMDVRLFAGKFFYLGGNTPINQFKTDNYHLNMTGPKGYEDYTYSNYFIGRNEFDRFPSQQIMISDGGFKVRTDLLSNKIGKTDDWLAAANFTTDFPNQVNPLSLLPFKIPVKIFLDLGTYAEAWKKNAQTGRFIYDAGLQLSLFKNIINIYMPILYSKVYKDYIKSTIPDKQFIKTISFSIDVQKISLRSFIPQIPF